MSSLIYQLLSSTFLLTIGLYHLISTTRHYLRSPRDFSAKPFHPLPLPNHHHLLRYLPLFLIIAALTTSFIHHLISSTTPDPLLLGHSPLHTITSLHSSFISFLFLLLTTTLFTTASATLPSDLIFTLSSFSFALLSSSSYSLSALQTSLLQSKCDSISALISAVSSILSLLLAVFPRFYPADVSLAASLCVQGFWALQTGLSLYVEGFIPQGCHRLLDVVSGVEGSTKCDLEESGLRAAAILDLVFVGYVILVVILVFVVFMVVLKVVGGSKRLGAYAPLPNTGGVDTNHVQLKTLSGTQA